MRHFFIIILLISLVACTPRRPAKVDEVGAKPHRSYTQSNARHTKRINEKSTHKVVKGDSLYSIGFKYQKDYKNLAKINNIKPPYQIYPDQIIRLKGETGTVVFKPTNNKNVSTSPIKTNKTIVATTEPSKKNNTPASKPTKKQPKKPASSTPKPSKNNSVVTSKPIQNQKPPPKRPVTVTTPTNTNLKWLWPTKGKIRTTFLASNPARKGISIGGQAGQPVKATEAGVVVYSGNGLLGYGELIIIKHNDAYLSAYGHNESLKVREGETVTRGQVIADLGSSGTNVNNLHFEIRKNGKPVNPLNYVKP